MNKMMMAGCAVAAAFASVAMPTKKELAQAQEPVEKATKADLAAYKAGQKTAKEVAENHLALAAKAKNQAEKYLLYQGAFKLYTRSGEYSRAIDTLGILKRDVKDVSPEVIDELVGQELRGLAKEQDEQIGRHQAKKTISDSAAPVRPENLRSRRVQRDRGVSDLGAAQTPHEFAPQWTIKRLLSSAQPRQKIVVPCCTSSVSLPIFTDPVAAQRKAKELGLWMFVYNMPFSCIRKDDFPNSSSFLRFLSKHCVFLTVDGWGSSSETPWVRSGSWPCCRILDSEGNLVSSAAKWGGTPTCHVDGRTMTEIVNGFLQSFDSMPAAFDALEQEPNEAGLAKLHAALSSLPEPFVNAVYLKWTELLVKVDAAGDRGWRAAYPYADKVLSVITEEERRAYCNDPYYEHDRAKRDKAKLREFLAGIDRAAFEKRLSALDSLQKKLTAIDAPSLTEDARRRLGCIKESVNSYWKRSIAIQKDFADQSVSK